MLVHGVVLGQAPTSSAQPAFKSGVNLVLVDVVVRDKSGAIVRNLTADDFELSEDGVRQQIVTFAYEEVSDRASPVVGASVFTPALTGNSDSVAAAATPLTSQDVAGHRLLTIVFDTSSMQPEDVQRATDSALKWVDDQMSGVDLVAVATIAPTLRVLTDFTTSKERVRAVIAGLSSADGTAFSSVDSSTAASDEAAASATDDSTAVDASAQELDTFNNDVRLRALKTLAEALQPIQQKKAIIYFSSGLQRNGTDNQVELRGAVNAAVRANAAIYPVDSRGLQAVVPGGTAREGSRGGLGAFSGRAVSDQFSNLAAQQETLTALASDTGGTAFTDTNDFGEAFDRVERDISSYYILGYSSTNTARDGRFRRIAVRMRNGRAGAKVQSTAGYYADRDFTHSGRSDREAMLQEQLAAPIPATDLPVLVTSGWFRLGVERYYIPISVAVPGGAVPPSPEKVTLDVAGLIRDERGAPVGRIRDTITVPARETGTLASRQVLYETSVTLPPGRFSAKIVVRENATGQMGTFEAPITIPDLKAAPIKISSIVVSTQLQPAGPKSASPLVRDGVELVPNLTHIIGRGQKLYFLYEVYDPAVDGGAPQIRTSLTFYRRGVKVFETPVVERTTIDAADRRASVFQFELPPASLAPGLYTCQVNIIDQIAGRFAFPRVNLYVR